MTPLTHDPLICGLTSYSTGEPICPACAAEAPLYPPRPDHCRRWVELVRDYADLRRTERNRSGEPTPPDPMGLPELARLVATAQREPGRSILRAVLIELLADDVAAIAGGTR